MCEKIDIKLELEYSKARIQDELVEDIKDANIDISRTGRDKELIELISDVWFEHLSSYIELYPEYFEKKIEIMKIFSSEIAPHPFPRSERNLRALATLRGATSGCEYAESFVLLKEIL